jgi:hypothetical protein
MIVMKNASRDAIRPPSNDRAQWVGQTNFPKPTRLPEIKDPTPEELEERAKKMVIYDDHYQALLNRILENERFEEAMDEIERVIEEHEDPAKRKTEIYQKSNLDLVKLIKSCNEFYSLCIKK